MAQKIAGISKKKFSKGESYGCDKCGLVVTIDEHCGCEDTCEIMCCSQPMKQRKVKVKAKDEK
jgi:hypothetical protein